MCGLIECFQSVFGLARRFECCRVVPGRMYLREYANTLPGYDENDIDAREENFEETNGRFMSYMFDKAIELGAIAVVCERLPEYSAAFHLS